MILFFDEHQALSDCLLLMLVLKLFSVLPMEKKRRFFFRILIKVPVRHRNKTLNVTDKVVSHLPKKKRFEAQPYLLSQNPITRPYSCL